MSDFVVAPLPPPTPIPVIGFARGRFEPVKDVFARAIAEQGGGGAALSIHHHGAHVVDLVGGSYKHDSLQLLFSVTKSLSAIAAAMAHSAGEIDLDEPISTYWPEFRKQGTAGITLRMVLGHRSGLPAFDRILTFDEFLAGKDDDAVGAQEPYWEPDTRLGYHAVTYGTILSGAFRRVLGKSVGDYVSKHIAQPLGLDLWIGLPDDKHDRVLPVQYSPPAISALRQAHAASSSIPPSALGRLMTEFDVFNDPRWYTTGHPAGSGVADARSLSALFAATLDGRLLAPDARRKMVATQSRGRDEVLGINMHYGSGMQLPFPQLPFLGSGSFGHEAAGGSVVFGDTDFDISVAWTSDVYPRMMGASSGVLTLLGTIRHCLTADSTPI